MSVERILSSASKVQILRVLCSRTSALSPKELEQETTKNISVIYDAVRELESEGVISSVKAEGKTNYYRLNKENEIAKQIKQLFDSEVEEYGLEDLPAHLVNMVFDVEDKLRNKVEGLKMILLFGSVARGDFTPESDIDLYIVLEDKNTEKEDQIYDILERYDREFSVITREVEDYRSDFKDEPSDFGKSILLEGSIILFSSDKELRHLIRGQASLRNARAHGLLQEKEEILELRDFMADKLKYLDEADKE